MNLKITALVLLIVMFASFIAGGLILVANLANPSTQKTVIDESQSVNLTDEIKTVLVDGSSLDVVVSSTKDNSFNVNLKGTMFGNMIVVSNISLESEPDILRIIIPEMKDGFNAFNFIDGNLTLYLEIPNSYSKDVTIGVASGDIFIKDLAVDNLNTKSLSGDTSIKDLTANNVNFSVASGDITLDKISAKYVVGSSMSGDVIVNDLSTETLIAESASGDMLLRLDSITNLNTKSMSGDSIIDIPDAGEYIFDLDALSGNIINGLEDRSVIKTGGLVSSAFNITSISMSGDVIIS